MMIDWVRARLHHKNIRAANILEYLKINLAVAEAAKLRAAHTHAQITADSLRELRVCASRKNLEFLVDQSVPTPAAVQRQKLISALRIPANAGVRGPDL